MRGWCKKLPDLIKEDSPRGRCEFPKSEKDFEGFLSIFSLTSEEENTFLELATAL